MFGCVCDQCLEPYETEAWGWPFICRVCSYNQLQADSYLSWLRYRELLDWAS